MGIVSIGYDDELAEAAVERANAVPLQLTDRQLTGEGYLQGFRLAEREYLVQPPCGFGLGEVRSFLHRDFAAARRGDVKAGSRLNGTRIIRLRQHGQEPIRAADHRCLPQTVTHLPFYRFDEYSTADPRQTALRFGEGVYLTEDSLFSPTNGMEVCLSQFLAQGLRKETSPTQLPSDFVDLGYKSLVGEQNTLIDDVVIIPWLHPTTRQGAVLLAVARNPELS